MAPKKWQPKRADWRSGEGGEGDTGKSDRMAEVEELTHDVHAKQRAEGFTDSERPDSSCSASSFPKAVRFLCLSSAGRNFFKSRLSLFLEKELRSCCRRGYQHMSAPQNSVCNPFLHSNLCCSAGLEVCDLVTVSSEKRKIG